MKKTRREYRSISTHTIEGLEMAEKLLRCGWKIIGNGLFMVYFEREISQ